MQNDNIVVIGLTNGDTIIGEFISGYQKEIQLKNVVSVIISSGQDSKGQVALAAFCPLAAKDATITLTQHHILYTTTPDAGFLQYYNSLYGSGIVVAPATTISKIDKLRKG
jgi:hypothetical protein